jgi:hypothetical protein
MGDHLWQNEALIAEVQRLSRVGSWVVKLLAAKEKKDLPRPKKREA